MKRFPPLVLWTLRFGLAGVFLWAGAAKLGDVQAFADGVAGFGAFPGWSVNGIALTVPILEILVAGCLLTHRWFRQGALAAVVLSLGFALLFVWAELRGVTVRCSCFGASTAGEMPNEVGMVRALGLFVAGALLYGQGIIRVLQKETGA